MNKNQNKSNVAKRPNANKLHVNLMRQKSQHEEFGSEQNPDSAQIHNFVEKQKSTDSQSPVSQRSAWH